MGNQVHFLDIYTKKQREIELADPSYKFVLLENSVLICFSKNRFDVFKIN